MSDRNDGGTAFPMCRGGGSETHAGGGSTWMPVYERGMSLRDWFAGMALPAIIGPGPHGTGGVETAAYWTVMVQRAYNVADAMIAQREKS